MDDVKKWVAGAAAVALLLLAGGWTLLIAPKRSEAADLRDQVSAQEATTQQLQTRLEVLREKAAGLPEQKAALAEVDRLVPHAADLPALVRALTEAGRSAGVDLVSVAPGTAAPVVAADAAAAPQAAGGLSAIPITLTAAGGFYELEQFLAVLEDLPRALRVTSLTLATGGEAAGAVRAAAGADLRMTIITEVYLAAEPSPPATPDAPAAPETAGTSPSASSEPATTVPPTTKDS